MRPVTRESVGERGIARRPATPDGSQCRTAVRETVLSRLGPRERVLDVGSTLTVTTGIDASSIERVDFSLEASERTRERLSGGCADGPAGPDGSTIDAFSVIDPREPTLPFPDDSFEAAVSVGPYDRPSLATETLTREVRRVLDPEGRFVVATRTQGAPPTVGGTSCRSHDGEAADALLAPGWVLERRDRVPDYDGQVGAAVARLPSRARSAVTRGMSALSTVADRRGDAGSTTVRSGRPLPHERWLEAALELLFRPLDDGGFWDPVTRRVVPALAIDGPSGEPRPIRDADAEERRVPLLARGLLRWRTSPAGTDAFDDRLGRQLSRLRSLAGARTNSADDRLEPAAVGATIDACARAGAGPFDAENLAVARDCFERTQGCEFERPGDAALLAGWATLAEATAEPGAEDDDFGAGRVLAALDEGLWHVGQRLFPGGRRTFDDDSSPSRETVLDALEGVCRAIQLTGRTDALEDVAAVLDRTVETRLCDDGAVVLDGEPRGSVSTLDGSGGAPSRSTRRRPRHQSRFVATVGRYVAAGGDSEYDRAVSRAMGWLDGADPHGRSLFDASAFDVPPRFVGPDGRAGAPSRQVVGVDDVGALIAATTDLIAGPLAPESAVGPERLPAPTRRR